MSAIQHLAWHMPCFVQGMRNLLLQLSVFLLLSMNLIACGNMAPQQATLAQTTSTCTGMSGILHDYGNIMGGPMEMLTYNGQNYQISLSSNSAATTFVSSSHQSANGTPFTLNVCFTGSFVYERLSCDYPNCPYGTSISLLSIHN